ncbi:hypothetical protein XELAEV_18010004mg [Xenopus laevis]|uniref:Uncharacterized protein n=1 Tax=Xenopus laevis TaxID=8355 RepID=A0A974I1D8_XENLA|nr:hypothetical protein XELAEV_18010004mg [Xenopus laevis]
MTQPNCRKPLGEAKGQDTTTLLTTEMLISTLLLRLEVRQRKQDYMIQSLHFLFDKLDAVQQNSASVPVSASCLQSASVPMSVPCLQSASVPVSTPEGPNLHSSDGFPAIRAPGMASRPVRAPWMASRPVSAPGMASRPVCAPGMASRPVRAPGMASRPVRAPGMASRPVRAPGMASQPVRTYPLPPLIEIV